jgi:hypothetical protein
MHLLCVEASAALCSEPIEDGLRVKEQKGLRKLSLFWGKEAQHLSSRIEGELDIETKCFPRESEDSDERFGGISDLYDHGCPSDFPPKTGHPLGALI